MPLYALIDTGSQVNAISEKWFKNKKKKLGNVETLKLSNTVIKAATGQKSKRVTQQVLLTTRIGDVEGDGVFLVVPELVKDCIIVIGLLEEYGCIIDFRNKQLTIPGKGNQKEVTAEIFMAEIFLSLIHI